GDLCLAEAQIQIEGVGHHSHEDVTDAEGCDKGQDQQRSLAVALEEFDEGADDGADEPGGDGALPASVVGAVQIVRHALLEAHRGAVHRHRRLGNHQSRHYTYTHEYRHGAVGQHPAVDGGQVQCPGAGG